MCCTLENHIGISIGDEKNCILLYADDIVLMADNEHDVQLLLNALSTWCDINDMIVNCSKSNVVHFRPQSVQRTVFNFTCGTDTLDIVDKYTYPGIVINAYLDYNVTAKTVAQSAGRALGLLIAKCKIMVGLSYDVYTKLYNADVWPAISYGASMWGVNT